MVDEISHSTRGADGLPQQAHTPIVESPTIPKESPSDAEWMASGSANISVDENVRGEDESIWVDASVMSLATSKYHWRIENNRKYHAYRDGAYWAPHDEASLKMDKYAHLLFLMTLNDRLFLAPIDNPKRVLDVGTGIGIWAQNFADSFPDAEVIGTDLSPVQEDHPAPNLRFELDDCESEWVWPVDHFDYIHIRMLYGSVADWPQLYQECYDHLAPGGYLEHSEINPIMNTDDDTKGETFDEAAKMIVECGQVGGKRLDVQSDIRDMIASVGFEDVTEHKYKWPLGDWPAEQRLKEIGIINARHWMEGIEGWTLRLLTRIYGWSPGKVKQWCQDLRSAIESRKHHIYQPLIRSVVVARKPMSSINTPN